MIPHLINRNSDSFEESFSIRWSRLPYFMKHWEHHDELELVYIIKCSGNRLIGDNIETIEEGELILLGKNLPHKWKNDQKYFEKDSTLIAESITIHFQLDFLGDSLTRVPELNILAELLARSNQGIQFLGECRNIIPPLLYQIHQMERGFDRLMMFVRILKILANESNYKYIASLGYVKKLEHTDCRMRKVYRFAMDKFQSHISLEQVAEMANMNKSAFCRYFKSISGKPFSQYLNEIRIGYACKLLLEKDHKPITEICFESGFNNLSNFNIQFRKYKHTSPSEFLHKIAS